jgi:ankyrin repeat protein
MSLQQAVATGNLREVKLHVATKSDLNKPDAEGWSPIHVAAMNGNLAIVTALSEGGADIRRKGKAGKTPLDVAREKNQTAIVQYLEQRASKGGRGLIDGGLGVSEVLDNP